MIYLCISSKHKTSTICSYHTKRAGCQWSCPGSSSTVRGVDSGWVTRGGNQNLLGYMNLANELGAGWHFQYKYRQTIPQIIPSFQSSLLTDYNSITLLALSLAAGPALSLLAPPLLLLAPSLSLLTTLCWLPLAFKPSLLDITLLSPSISLLAPPLSLLTTLSLSLLDWKCSFIKTDSTTTDWPHDAIH